MTKVLLIGHPSCGGEYLRLLFKAFNHDIGNKEWGESGLENWLMSIDVDIDVDIERPLITTDCKIIHYICDPRYALQAILNNADDSYNLRQKVLYQKYKINLNDFDQVDRAIVSFITWNKMIEDKIPDLMIRIEDSLNPIQEFFNNELSFDKNSVPLPELSFDESAELNITQIRPDLLQALDKWCVRYGYPIISNPQTQQSQAQPPTQQPQAQPPTQQQSIAPQHLVLGPRGRNNNKQYNKNVSNPSESAADGSIKPRLVHSITAQQQGTADLTSREKGRRGGFAIKPKK